MNYNNLKYASIVQDMKNLRILYLEGNVLTFVPKFHDKNDVTSFRLDLRQVIDGHLRIVPNRKDFVFVGLILQSPLETHQRPKICIGYFSGNKIKEIFKKNLARKTPTKTDTNAHYRTFYSSIDLSGEHSIKIFYHCSIAMGQESSGGVCHKSLPVP